MMQYDNNNLNVELAVLKECMRGTVKELERLNLSFESISKKQNELGDKIQCNVHKQRMDSIQWQISWIWGVVVVILVAIIGAGITAITNGGVR